MSSASSPPQQTGGSDSVVATGLPRRPDGPVAGVIDGPPPTADALRRAIGQEQLVLHYHPVVELGTGRVHGVEALVRWQHPQLGLLPPAAFVPLAEESGLIVELGEWVLRTGASQATSWSAAGRPLDMAINLSPLQMVAPGFADRSCALLAGAGAPPGRIVLEVTESALLEAPHAADALGQLHDAGVRLALDDFGTGYSCFSYLRRFPIDIIKVDRSFVAGLGVHPDDDAIVASVAGLARRTGKALVAEGVETDAQVALLQGLGVQSAQGFLWTSPLPLELLEPWIAGFELRPPPFDAAGTRSRRRHAPSPEGPEAERILQLHHEGASLHTIAAALNSEGLRTSSGVRWHTSSVAKVITQRGAWTRPDPARCQDTPDAASG